VCPSSGKGADLDYQCGKSGEPAATHAPAAKTATSSGSRTKHKVSAGEAAATSATSRKATRSSSRKKRTARVRGQKKIDADRAQAIQDALIREHYLNGQATGTWNQASEDAMRRYQPTMAGNLRPC